MDLCREVLAGVTAVPYTADFVVSEAESNTLSDTRHKIRQIERLGRPKGPQRGLSLKLSRLCCAAGNDAGR